MISALNPATIGGAPPLKEYIALAEKNGFGGVEIDLGAAKQLAEETSWADVRALFEHHGVAPATFGLPVDYRGEEAKFKEDLQKLPAIAKDAAEIGCTRTATWLPPAITGSFDEFNANIVPRFLAIAKVLGDYNIRLALEFVGPDTCRVGPKSHGPTPFIHTMPQTLELIETIDAPQNNVGLLLDTFHWFTSHGTVENLLMLTPDKIVHVHINDAPNVPISEQEDFKRLLPGDGVINLVGFLKSLGYIGYTGFVAVETFNKELSSQGHEIAAQKTGAAMERLLAQLH